MTLADYKDQNIDIIGYNYNTFKINKDGYENLMRHLDKFPITYNAILNDLKFLYGDLHIMIQVYNERLRNTVYRQIDFSHTQNWDIHRRRFSTISNDELYYYYENDAYKRHVLKYMNDRSWVYRGSHRYRTNAIEAYMKIDSLLNENDRELPFNLLGMVESSFEVEKFLGNYKFVDSAITNTIQILLKNHHLYSDDNQGNKFKHYRIDDKRYFYMTSTKNNGYPVVWEFNNNTDGCIVINFLNAEIPMLKKID